MDCKQFERLILQFIKDEMDDRTKKQFLKHVENCNLCREELSIQFLVTTGMQRLENGDTFDLNRELKDKMALEWKHLHIKRSLQNGLYTVELASMAIAILILFVVVL